ncbi:hypothetical protein ACFL6S_12370 [Candidatus Poribacteria bacterium]
MDREKIIQQIVTAMATLEKCSDQEVEDTKKFLRWMSDDSLQDMREKHMKALEKRTPALIKK